MSSKACEESFLPSPASTVQVDAYSSWFLSLTLLVVCRENRKIKKNNNTLGCIKSRRPSGRRTFPLTVVCLVNVLSFAKEAAYMCVTAEEEELALRWLMIGECLLAPQNHRSSFSGPGWTLRSLSTGPCCVTTYQLCSLAVPSSPNCSAVLLPTGRGKKTASVLHGPPATVVPICHSGAAVWRVRFTAGEEEWEQDRASVLWGAEAVVCLSVCLCALRRSAGSFTPVTRREGSTQHHTVAALSLSMAPRALHRTFRGRQKFSHESRTTQLRKRKKEITFLVLISFIR